MEKIDYGDINKFLVSVGIILIAISILGPFFYYKEDFGIYLSPEEISKFRTPIQDLIINKQTHITLIQNIIPYTALILFIFGLFLAIIGLYRWSKRQAKIDEKFDKEIQKLDLEIESLTPEEKIEKAKQESQEIELAEQIQTSNQSEKKSDSYINYMNVEKVLYNAFIDLNSPNFDVLIEKKLGNKYYIDLLLKAKTENYADRIIEIKYFRKNMPTSVLTQAVYKLNTYIAYYKENTNKAVIPVLLIVYNKQNIRLEEILRAKSQITDFSSDLPNMSRLKVEFIDENNLEEFNPRVLLKR